MSRRERCKEQTASEVAAANGIAVTDLPIPSVIFPGTQVEIYKSLSERSDDIIKKRMLAPHYPVVVHVLIGCFDYLWGPTGKSYQTGFIYRVFRHPYLTFAIDTHERRIPASDLWLQDVRPGIYAE